MSEKRLLLVNSRPVEGREQEYVNWYTTRHIEDVTAIPGFTSGRFHRCMAPDGTPTGEFIAVYEVEDVEPATLMQSLMSRRSEMDIPDTLDPTSAKFTFLIPA